MDNQFESPRDLPPKAGQLQAGTAVTEGLSAVLSNLLPLAGALLLGIVVYVLSFCTCFGWIFVLPLLFYGAGRLVLQVVDGQASVSTLWSATSDPVKIGLSMWGVLLLYGALLLPTMVLGAVLSSAIDPIQATIAASAIGVLYGLFLVRFQFAPFLVIEGRTGVSDAFGRSFAATGPLWGKMILLQLLNTLLTAPVTVLSVGIQIISQDLQTETDPEKILEQMQPAMFLYGALFLSSAISGTLAWSIFASAYRQVFGPNPVRSER